VSLARHERSGSVTSLNVDVLEVRLAEKLSRSRAPPVSRPRILPFLKSIDPHPARQGAPSKFEAVRTDRNQKHYPCMYVHQCAAVEIAAADPNR
jgi:hypothetical protein